MSVLDLNDLMSSFMTKYSLEPGFLRLLHHLRSLDHIHNHLLLGGAQRLRLLPLVEAGRLH